MEVKGRDLVAGLPKTLMLTSQEVRGRCWNDLADRRFGAHHARALPAGMSADLVDRGLCGGWRRYARVDNF